MTKILQSHFGEVAIAPRGGSAAAGIQTPSRPLDSGGKGPGGSLEARALLPLCIFTCYWGIDETPVVVGLRMDRGTGQSGRGAQGTETVTETMQLHIRHLKVRMIS